MIRTYTLIFALGLAFGLHVQAASPDLASVVQETRLRNEYIIQLLSHGANPNIMINGCPLIIYVTMKIVRKKTPDEAKWYEILETLLKHRAIVDNLDTNSYTALMYAAYYGHYDAVALLLNYNAQAGFTNAYGESPVIAAHKGHDSAPTERQKQQYRNIIALLTRYVNKRR